MELQALSPAAPRYVHRPIQLVLVRANSTLFYSVAAASLLEAVAPVYAQRLLDLLRGDAALANWVVTRWLPQKAARAKALQVVEDVAGVGLGSARPARACVRAKAASAARATVARELLARCVAASQSGVLYGCLARCADDPSLRMMAASFAHEEAASFRRFRAAYDRKARDEGLGLASAWQTALACVHTARDTHLPLVYGYPGAGSSHRLPDLRLGVVSACDRDDLLRARRADAFFPP